MKLIKTLLAIGMTLAVAMPVSAQIAYTPIHFKQTSGTRPFIDAKMNGRSFQLMVHSSAESYMMTDHAIAESIGVTNLKKTEDYGIDSAGHVSALGRAVSVLKTLEVAGREQGDVPVEVFETPHPEMEGMLGIRWLRSQLVIVDYDSYRVGIPRTIHDSEKEDERLIGVGFQKLKMTWDARTERYFVTGTINGVAGRFLVSTVSHDFLDPAFAKHAGVELGPVIDQEHGPTGTTVDALLAKRQITLAIDGKQTAVYQPRIMDMYAYAGVKAPSNPAERIDGTIGTDFMLANQAVIDFGTESLFITSVTHATGPTEVRPSVASFTIESIGGSPRPIVTALFNGHPMRMIVHSDSVFFAQLRHSEAAAVGVVLAGGHQKFGIDREGHVSDLGLDNGTVASLRVGESENKDAPVGVFEIPQSDLGMLGIGWLNQNRVILDYGRKQVTIAPTSERVQAIGSELRKAGYVPIPMTFDEHYHHYLVRATINGVTRSMTVGTASPFLIDTAFADAAGVKRGPGEGDGGGPTGTKVATYPLGAPVRVSINGWTSPEISVGIILDLYGYGARQRPADPADATGGYLGGDFLQKTDAVVDFGTRILFVRGEENP